MTLCPLIKKITGQICRWQTQVCTIGPTSSKVYYIASAAFNNAIYSCREHMHSGILGNYTVEFGNIY